MSGDNLACHRGSTLIFSGGGGGGGGQGYQSTPQSPGQIPLQSTVGCHTDSEDFTYPAGARFLLCTLQGTRELGGDPVSQPAKCSLVWCSTSWHCLYRVQCNQKQSKLLPCRRGVDLAHENPTLQSHPSAAMAIPPHPQAGKTRQAWADFLPVFVKCFTRLAPG